MSGYTKKDLKGLNKAELVALCEEEGIAVPDENTNAQLKDLLMAVVPDEGEGGEGEEEGEEEGADEGEGEEGESGEPEAPADPPAPEEEKEVPKKKPVGALQKPKKTPKPKNLPDGMCAYECISGRVNIGDGNLYEKGGYIVGAKDDPIFKGLVKRGVLSVA